MPSINWAVVFASPLSSLKILVLASSATLRLLLGRILLPFSSRPLSLRNDIARSWIGTTFVHNPQILYSEPSKHDVLKVEAPGFTTYVVPTTKPADLKLADAVVIYVHGGGMAMGHPLQYLKDYQRWIQHGREKGGKFVFLAPQYPLSTSMKWPAQRSAIVSLYEWALSQGVLPSRIVFAGDSAGGNLALLTLLYIRDQAPLPQPACGIVSSPWTDMTGAETINSPNWHSDFMFQYNETTRATNDLLRPSDLPYDTPEISAALVEDVGNMPAQLVFWAPTEILCSDSTRWIERSRKAGVDITEHIGHGQMHTYAMGWPICDYKTQDQCDALLVEYIMDHVS